MFRLLLPFSLLLSLIVHAQTAPIVIDDDFGDWDPSLPSFTDGQDNPAGLDLLDMQVTNDYNYLYIKFTLSEEIDLTDNITPHDLWLYIDADNDPSTGFVEQTGYGVELAVDFNTRFAWFNAPNPNVQVTYKDIGLFPAPTVTSATYEIAINRFAQPNGNDVLFTHDSIRVLLKDQLDGDAMPNDGQVFSYAFSDAPVPEYERIDLTKDEEDHIRIVHYNLHSNSGWTGANNLSSIEAILKALNADLYAFSESAGTSEAEAKSFMDTWLPLSTANGWYTVKHGGLITCSKWPFFESYALTRQLVSHIDLPESYAKDFILVNAHLSCCSNDNGRQEQVDEFIGFLRDAKDGVGSVSFPDSTPIVYGGDLNLVGFAQQLTTLLTGDIQDTQTWGTPDAPDWDDTPFTDAVPIHADQRMSYTWRHRGNSSNHYPPGRLDFQLYSDAVLTLEKAFIIDTKFMNQARLAQWALDPSDTDDASDHLPVTADYALPVIDVIDTTDTTTSILELKAQNIVIYPNPSRGAFTVQTDGKLTSVVLKDLLGKDIPLQNISPGQYAPAEPTKGLYLLKLKVDGKEYSEKILLLGTDE